MDVVSRASGLGPPAVRPQARPTATPERSGPADFGQAPFIAIWEVTRACALCCLHCRADAVAGRDSRELTSLEAMRLIDQIRSFGDPSPLFVLTGGDPMRRPDLAQLVEYASSSGLSVALTPSGTAAVTAARLQELHTAGLCRIAVSLDGPTAEAHDAFRGVRGSHLWTMKIIDAAAALGLPLQINTTLGKLTYPHLRAMADRMQEMPIVLWAVFFLIQTGRGASLEQIDADECEQALRFLRDLSKKAPFGIKTTEAPQYRRVVLEDDYADEGGSGPAHVPARRPHIRAPRSVNDGNGFVFIDHVGQICPSGFLPLVRGNVRQHSLVDVYRDDEMFRRLRDPGALQGKCGRCEYRVACGGSRSRAYAATGSPFASDPLCPYVPATWRASGGVGAGEAS